MKPCIRIESDGSGTGTKVIHVADDGTETDLSGITTRVSWEARADSRPAAATIHTLPAAIVATIAPDLVRFVPGPALQEAGA